MIVCQFFIGLAAGALVDFLFDDGDSKAAPKGLRARAESFAIEFAAFKQIMENIEVNVGGDLSDSEIANLTQQILDKSHDVTHAMSEGMNVARILSNSHDSSMAEKLMLRLKYDMTFIEIDNTVTTSNQRIYSSVDPSDSSGDDELNDSFGFEGEIELEFGIMQMAQSEEDIAQFSDIQDFSITDPIDEISQDREISMSDDSMTPEDEISAIEETTPFEDVIYPNMNDYDLDNTDDAEELIGTPLDEYRPHETIDDQIEWMEQELDSFSDELSANTFEAKSSTFDQDESSPFLTDDDTYFEDDTNMNVIDFQDYHDDVFADVLSLTANDTMGNPFFNWIEASEEDVLDLSPF